MKLKIGYDTHDLKEQNHLIDILELTAITLKLHPEALSNLAWQ